MASIIDLGLVQQFSDIFSIILIFLVVYAALEMTKVLGANKGVHSLVALMIALLMAVNPNALKIISGISPLFTVFIIFIMFLFVAALFAGFTKGEVIQALGGQSGAAFWIIIVSVVLLGIVIGNVFGQQLLEQFSASSSETVNTQPTIDTNGDGVPDAVAPTTDSADFQKNFGRTLFHPKILGLILILLIGSFTIRMLTSAPLGLQ